MNGTSDYIYRTWENWPTSIASTAGSTVNISPYGWTVVWNNSDSSLGLMKEEPVKEWDE